MTLFRSIPVGVALLVILASISGPATVQAQAPTPGPNLPLRPRPEGGFPIVPFMEGWYENGDGTYTISFGYSNRNDDPVELPIGAANSIEPARFSGMQPTTFATGRHRGVFTVILPPELAREDIWWVIQNPNGEETRTPGRTRSTAYQLDKIPRPHGSVAPLIWFEEGGEQGQYPPGIVDSRTRTVRVGELLDLSVYTMDPSVRDTTDRRFRNPIEVTATWFKHQGPPGVVEFVRHPSTPLPEPPEEGRAGGAGGGGGGGGGRGGGPPPAHILNFPEGRGNGIVQARFPQAGQYILRVLADNWGVTDSSAADQCCWTNGYVRVNVTP